MKKRAIRRQLNTILSKLETMQIEIEATLANIDMAALGIDGDPEPIPDTTDYANLRWRTQNEDGTWRDCIE